MTIYNIPIVYHAVVSTHEILCRRWILLGHNISRFYTSFRKLSEQTGGNWLMQNCDYGNFDPHTVIALHTEKHHQLNPIGEELQVNLLS